MKAYIIEYHLKNGNTICFAARGYKIENSLVRQTETLREVEYLALKRQYHSPLCAAFSLAVNGELVASTVKDIVVFDENA